MQYRKILDKKMCKNLRRQNRYSVEFSKGYFNSSTLFDINTENFNLYEITIYLEHSPQNMYVLCTDTGRNHDGNVLVRRGQLLNNPIFYW